MIINTIRRILTLTLILSTMATIMKGENQISPEKQSLIKELMAAMDTEKTQRAVLDMILAQIEKGISQEITQQMEAEGMKDLKPEEREQMEKKRAESRDRFWKKYRDMLTEEKFVERITEVIGSLYSKHYSAAEIKDLIKFYQSPTGKKSIAVMPELATESMQKTQEWLMPRITKLTKELVEEEKKTETKK